MTTTSIFDAYFFNKPVLITWKRVVIPRGSRVFTIVGHFELYGEACIVIKDIDKPNAIMVKFNDIETITCI